MIPGLPNPDSKCYNILIIRMQNLQNLQRRVISHILIYFFR